MDIKHKALSVILSKSDQGLSTDFVGNLDRNVNLTCKLLKIERAEIRKLVPVLNYDLPSSESTQWSFINLCFHILLTTEENSDIISVSYLSHIRTAFQFIVSLGVLPNLIPGVGIDMSVRFKNADKFPIEDIGVQDKYYRLCCITRMLLKCLTIDVLQNYVLENHFNDLLAMLLQLTSAPLKKPDESSEKFYLEVMFDRKHFQTDLHNLTLKTHQPLLFRELMVINGNKKSPNWLKNCVFKILSERVQAKNGVESVIRALFDSQSNDTGQNWKHWEVLTKLLMTKPNYVNETEYYGNICGQLLKLLDKKTFEGGRVDKFETAVVLSTRCLFEMNEKLCFENFLKPLTAILETFTQASKGEVRTDISDKIEQIIFILHSIYINYKTNDKIIPIHTLTPVFPVIFNLFCSCYTTNKTKLTDELSDLIVKFVKNSDDRTNLYEYMLFDTQIRDMLPLKTGYTFEVKEEIHFLKATIDSNARVDCCVNLLEKTKSEIFITTFFTYLLSNFINVFQKCDLSENFDKLDINLTEKKITIYQILLKLLENNLILSNLKKNPTEILIFSENFLKILTQKNTHKSTNYDSEHFQTLFIIIMIISTILKNCENQNLIEDFQILRKTLKQISIETANNEIKMLISEINLRKGNINQNEGSEYEKAIEEICSPLIPEQAHGLATLVKLIEKKDLETCSKKQYVLNIFQQNLKSEETFIYLRAIAGLSILADTFPNIILETLTDEYTFPKGATEKDVEVRMKLGEVLMRTVRSLGETTIKYKSLLLNTFLTVSRDPDPFIRASSLSNLGEICQVLGYRLGPIITEILTCIQDSLTYEVVEVRRAAFSVIRQLFVGLGQEMLSVLKEDILPIYRTLKSTYRDDPDSVARLQAQLALEELNEIMKQLLAPEIHERKTK